MAQKDKELLLKDLCARLPYNVKVKVECGDIPYAPTILSKLDIKRKVALFNFEVRIENCKPYLRPMSSMTEEEKNELTEMTITSPNLETAAVLFRERYYEEEPQWRNDWAICSLPKVLNWLNAHHFDYRGLIEKGLAIAVTEENNPYKE